MQKIFLTTVIIVAGFTLKAQQAATHNKLVFPADSLYKNEIRELENVIAGQQAEIIELKQQIGLINNRSVQTNYGKKPVIDRRGSKQVVYK